MKKSTIKLIAMLLTVVLMLPNFAGADALNENEENNMLEEFRAVCALQNDAKKANAKIHKLWKNDDGITVYPDSFGGCYIDDSGKLVIKIVDNNVSLRADIEESVDDVNVLVFKNTDISFNELNAIGVRAVEELSAYTDVLSATICSEKSVVEIDVAQDVPVPYSLSTISDHITICVAKPVDMHVACKPGSLMSDSSGAGVASLGWHGKFSFSGVGEKKCLLTAGHTAKIGEHYGTSLYYNGNLLFSGDNFSINSKNCYSSYAGAYIINNKTYINGDYSFLRCDALSADNKMYSTDIISSGWLDDGYENLPENAEVMKGYGISGARTGRIAGTSVDDDIAVPMTWTDGSFTFTNYTLNVIKIYGDDGGSAFSSGGDSGCIIFTYIDGAPVLCGIVAGGNYDMGLSVDYMTPMQLICKAGFTPYPYTNSYIE